MSEGKSWSEMFGGNPEPASTYHSPLIGHSTSDATWLDYLDNHVAFAKDQERATRDRHYAAIIAKSRKALASRAKRSSAIPDKHAGRPHPLVLLAGQTKGLAKISLGMIERIIALEETVGLQQAQEAPDAIPTDCVYLHVQGQITAETEERVLRNLSQSPSAPEIFITIDSVGGRAESAEAIFGAINRHRAQTKTALVLDQCFSAATLILMACENRYSLEDATFLFHRCTVDGVVPPEAFESCSASDGIILQAAVNCGIDQSRYIALRASEDYFDIHEAVDLGLVTQVITETDFGWLFPEEG